MQPPLQLKQQQPAEPKQKGPMLKTLDQGKSKKRFPDEVREPQYPFSFDAVKVISQLGALGGDNQFAGPVGTDRKD